MAIWAGANREQETGTQAQEEPQRNEREKSHERGRWLLLGGRRCVVMGRWRTFAGAKGWNAHPRRRGTFPQALAPATGSRAERVKMLVWGQPIGSAVCKAPPTAPRPPNLLHLSMESHTYQVMGVVAIFKQGNRGPERSRILSRVTWLTGGRAELKQEGPHPPTLAHWLLWRHGRRPGAGGLTAWLSASPCRVSTPFTWSVLQHVGVRAAPAAAPSHHPSLPAAVTG